MKFNKLILISLLLLALVSFGAVSAVEDANSTEDTTVQAADVNDELAADNIDENLHPNDEILKEESTPIVITNETFNNYFDDEGRILDSVAEGSTLDFQGQITSSENIKAIYINKSVNIISSTKDATITLNTKNGQLGKENITGRFIVEGAAELKINDVTFNRTQVLIYDSDNIVFDNVNFISDNYRIVPKLHDNYNMVPLVNTTNVKKFTFKNSQVYLYDFGSVVIGCYDTKEALFDNNTFSGYAGKTDITNGSGKGHSFKHMIYFPEQDASVTINNNKFYGNSHFSGFLRVYTTNVLFVNNYEEHDSPHVSTSEIWLGSANSNVIVRDNDLLDLDVGGNATVYDNRIKCHFYADTVLVYNNTFGSTLKGEEFGCNVCIGSNSTFYNDVYGGVTISGSNVMLKDSTINRLTLDNGAKNITVKNNCIGSLTSGTNAKSVTIGSTETYITNNTIGGSITLVKSANSEVYIVNNNICGGITIEKSANCEIRNNLINGTINIETSGCFIEYNVIKAFDSDYAVSIKSGKDYVYNEISDNEIYSKWYCGDNAISYDENYLNYIEYNIPANQIGMFVNNTVEVFDYGGNTTISVNVPGVSGNVTIDVNGVKYVVGLVNGGASYVLTKYSVGFNHVTVIYYDVFDDVWAIGHANFTVNKVTYCPVQLVHGEIFESKYSDINFILPEDADGSIYVNLAEEIYSVDIEQAAKGGNNIITLPGLPEGNYTITATFISEKYVTNSSLGIISIVHKPVYKLTAANVVMNYNGGSKYNVLVTKDGKAVASEKIKITLNGKTTEVKTDKNGYATLTVTNLPGKYTLTATYKGQSVKNTIQVKQNLKTSKVTVKKSAKSFVLKATLSKVKGKKLTFKFKGKKYTAKTDKNGVAKVTIKKNVIKKLKKGKKYTFTVKYVSNTVKNKVIVK